MQKEKSKRSDLTNLEKKELKELRKRKDEFAEIQDLLNQKNSFEIYKIIPVKSDQERITIPIVLASDWHIDEVVEKDAVLGLNEFNIDIAKNVLMTFLLVLLN